jgi:predicted phage terminase large subunit-like protein
MIISPQELGIILRTDLMSFILRCFIEINPQTRFLSNWHIELIAAKLQQVALGKVRRLIINIPPRNLKSIAASIALPAWYLGLNPSGHVIAASYGQDLATKFARDTRTIMMSPWYKRLFPTRISPLQRAADDFATIQGGTRMATSVGGTLTGRGADIIIIDDAMKPDDALSEVRRAAANEWFDNTLQSRLNSKEDGAIVIIMQRLHQDDLVGHVLEQEQWDVLSLSAIAQEDETYPLDSVIGRRIITRKAGTALHPERESVARYNVLRASMGDFNFESQYQQNPMPKGGAMVKTSWLQFYGPNDLPKRFSTIVQSWDTANKTSELNDYSACTTWGYFEGKCYLLHVFRKRLIYPDLKRAVMDLKKQFNPSSIIIEDKASGTQLIQDIKADGISTVKGVEPLSGMDKVMRLNAKTPMFENGFVFLPKQAPWLDEYVRELTGFPGAKFDDQVDSTTQALEFLEGPGRNMEIWMRAFGVTRVVPPSQKPNPASPGATR